MNKKNELINRLTDIQKNYGNNPIFSEEINILRDRLNKFESSIAVVGQFSVGKSALLNALLGEKILSSRTLETTKVITRIRYCESRQDAKVIVKYIDGTNETKSIISLEDLNDLTTFQGKHINDDIDYVDLYWPLKFLNKELVLIDTPGANSLTASVFEKTEKQLRSSAAIIYLFSATKGLDKADYEIIAKYSEQKKKIFLVGTHRDLISDIDWIEVKKEVQKNIKAHENLKDISILSVSVLQAIDAKSNGNFSELAQSQLPVLEQELMNYMSKEEYRKAEYVSLEFDVNKLEEEITFYEEELKQENDSREADKQIRLNRLITLIEKEYAEVLKLGQNLIQHRSIDLNSIKQEYDRKINMEESETLKEVKEHFKKVSNNLKILMQENPDENKIRKSYKEYSDKIMSSYVKLNDEIKVIIIDFLKTVTQQVRYQDEKFIKLLKESNIRGDINWQDFSGKILDIKIKKPEINIEYDIFENFEESNKELKLDKDLLLKRKEEIKLKISTVKEKYKLDNKRLKDLEFKKIKDLGVAPDKKPIYSEKGILFFKTQELSHYDYTDLENWQNNLRMIKKELSEEKVKISAEYKKKLDDYTQNIIDIDEAIMEVEFQQDEELEKLLAQIFDTIINHSNLIKTIHKDYMKEVKMEWTNIFKTQQSICLEHLEEVEQTFEKFIQEEKNEAISKVYVN